MINYSRLGYERKRELTRFFTENKWKILDTIKMILYNN